MNVLLVYANPEPTSFTGALLKRAIDVLSSEGHSFEVSDLYGEGFDPVAGRGDFWTVASPDRFDLQAEQALAEESGSFVPEVRREQDRAARAELFVFLFPLWWGGPPAIVKGWFDRVMSYGFGYMDGARYDRGVFRGRSGLCCVPTGGTLERFSEGGTYGPIGEVLRPFHHCALRYVGLEVLDDFVAYAAPRVDDAQRRRYLDDWDAHLRNALRRAAATSKPVEVSRGSVATRPLQFEPHVVVR